MVKFQENDERRRLKSFSMYRQVLHKCVIYIIIYIIYVCYYLLLYIIYTIFIIQVLYVCYRIEYIISFRR